MARRRKDPDRIPIPGFEPKPIEKRKYLTKSQRDRLLKEHGYICCECNGKIVKGQRWQDEHVISLAGQGGTNDWRNRAPIHADKPPFDCVKRKNERDAAINAKGRRIRGETRTKPRGRPLQSRPFPKRKGKYRWPKRPLKPPSRQRWPKR